MWIAILTSVWLKLKRFPAGACALLLFTLNAAIVWPLFRVEYLRYFFSIEGTFIAISRAMLEQPHYLAWWPWWGTGLPFAYTYLPGIPATIALLCRVTGWSPALSYHALTAFVYCLGPVAVFLLGRKLSGNIPASLAAGLVYSLVSPATILIPLVRLDAGGIASPQRLRALVYYGGGPQVVTLTLVPVAIVLIHASLGSRRLWVHVLAGAAAAAVALTDAFGAAFLFLAVICLFFATEQRSLVSKLKLLLGIGVSAYLAVCPWLPPSLLRIAARNSEIAGGDYHWSPRSFAAMAIVILSFAAAWLVSRRWKAPHRFILLLSAVLTSIVVPASFGLNAMPQAMRYHVEMEIPLCLLLAFGMDRLWRIVPRRVGLAMIAFGLVLAAWQTGHYREFARRLILPPAEVRSSVEYRIATRMAAELGPERVMIAGSPALWANVFADVRQLAGAHDQFNANPSLLAAGLIQYGGRDAARLDGSQYAVWLKAFGAHAVNVPGPFSEEPYKPFHENPNLFEGLLPVIWRDRGDTIYRVPQRGAGLAHVVPVAAIVRKAPASPSDSSAAARYVAALDDPSLPLASWQDRGTGDAVIHAAVASGQVVSVQITYDQGWRAMVDGVRQRTYADGLGMLVIEPACRGDCEIDLRFDGGIEAKVTWWFSIATLCGVAVCLWRNRRRSGS